jgi:hypothetical protein
MADEISSDSDVETSADRLLAVGEEVKKRRGRPPGSKNKPRDGEEAAPAKLNQANQKKVFAGALIALFSLFAIIAGWFGYEYFQKLEENEAADGATYLLPIAEKIGGIATAAFYLAFPIWLLTTVNSKFRRKAVEAAPENSGAVSRSNAGSDSPVDGRQPVNGTPASGVGSGFVSTDPPIESRVN